MQVSIISADSLVYLSLAKAVRNEGERTGEFKVTDLQVYATSSA